MASISEYIDETDKNRGRQIQRILNSLDAVHATKAELKEMETRLKKRMDQQEATQKENRNSNTHTPAYGRIKFTAPIFNGSDHDQPMKFLRDLRNYCNAVDADDYESRYIISQSLQGPASEWWQITESETDTWKNFEQRFTARFWSEARQSEIRERLQFGQYIPQMGIRQCEYAMRLFSQSRDLTTRPTESEIIRLLARHFSADIHSAILSASNYSKEALFNLLERFDNAGIGMQRRESGYNAEPNQRRWEPRPPIQKPRDDQRDKRYEAGQPRGEQGRNEYDRGWTDSRNRPPPTMPQRTAPRINIIETGNELNRQPENNSANASQGN